MAKINLSVAEIDLLLNAMQTWTYRKKVNLSSGKWLG